MSLLLDCPIVTWFNPPERPRREQLPSQTPQGLGSRSVGRRRSVPLSQSISATRVDAVCMMGKHFNHMTIGVAEIGKRLPCAGGLLCG